MDRLINWALEYKSRYVTICNAHVVVTASDNASYRDIINGSDMATPDGAPVAWMLRRQGFANQPRISGPDVMWALCEREVASRSVVSSFSYAENHNGVATLSRTVIR